MERLPPWRTLTTSASRCTARGDGPDRARARNGLQCACGSGAWIGGAGRSRSMRKNAPNMWRIGWPKPSAVSCIREVCRGSRNPMQRVRRMRPWAIEAHQQKRDADDADDAGEQDDAAVRGLLPGDRSNTPDGSRCVRWSGPSSMPVTPAAGRSASCGTTPMAMQPSASQARPSRSSQLASCASVKRGFARLAEEDTP